MKNTRKGLYPASYTYKVTLHSTGESPSEQDENPVIRIWSPSPLEHPELRNCTPEKPRHVHLWLRMGDANTETESAHSQSDSAEFTLVLCLPDSTATHLQTTIDLILALQCDGIHSVLWNAELPDLAALFSPFEPWSGRPIRLAQIDIALANRPAQREAALNTVLSIAKNQRAQGLLLLRAHAPSSFSNDADLLKKWHSQQSSHLRWLCWDVYDQTLQPGECRYVAIRV